MRVEESLDEIKDMGLGPEIIGDIDETLEKLSNATLKFLEDKMKKSDCVSFLKLFETFCQANPLSSLSKFPKIIFGNLGKSLLLDVTFTHDLLPASTLLHLILSSVFRDIREDCVCIHVSPESRLMLSETISIERDIVWLSIEVTFRLFDSRAESPLTQIIELFVMEEGTSHILAIKDGHLTLLTTHLNPPSTSSTLVVFDFESSIKNEWTTVGMRVGLKHRFLHFELDTRFKKNISVQEHLSTKLPKLTITLSFMKGVFFYLKELTVNCGPVASVICSPRPLDTLTFNHQSRLKTKKGLTQLCSNFHKATLVSKANITLRYKSMFVESGAILGQRLLETLLFLMHWERKDQSEEGQLLLEACCKVLEVHEFVKVFEKERGMHPMRLLCDHMVLAAVERRFEAGYLRSLLRTLGSLDDQGARFLVQELLINFVVVTAVAKSVSLTELAVQIVSAASHLVDPSKLVSNLTDYLVTSEDINLEVTKFYVKLASSCCLDFGSFESVTRVLTESLVIASEVREGCLVSILEGGLRQGTKGMSKEMSLDLLKVAARSSSGFFISRVLKFFLEYSNVGSDLTLEVLRYFEDTSSINERALEDGPLLLETLLTEVIDPKSTKSKNSPRRISLLLFYSCKVDQSSFTQFLKSLKVVLISKPDLLSDIMTNPLFVKTLYGRYAKTLALDCKENSESIVELMTLALKQKCSSAWKSGFLRNVARTLSESVGESDKGVCLEFIGKVLKVLIDSSFHLDFGKDLEFLELMVDLGSSTYDLPSILIVYSVQLLNRSRDNLILGLLTLDPMSLIDEAFVSECLFTRFLRFLTRASKIFSSQNDLLTSQKMIFEFFAQIYFSFTKIVFLSNSSLNDLLLTFGFFLESLDSQVLHSVLLESLSERGVETVEMIHQKLSELARQVHLFGKYTLLLNSPSRSLQTGSEDRHSGSGSIDQIFKKRFSDFCLNCSLIRFKHHTSLLNIQRRVYFSNKRLFDSDSFFLDDHTLISATNRLSSIVQDNCFFDERPLFKYKLSPFCLRDHSRPFMKIKLRLPRQMLQRNLTKRIDFRDDMGVHLRSLSDQVVLEAFRLRSMSFDRGYLCLCPVRRVLSFYVNVEGEYFERSLQMIQRKNNGNGRAMLRLRLQDVRYVQRYKFLSQLRGVRLWSDSDKEFIFVLPDEASLSTFLTSLQRCWSEIRYIDCKLEGVIRKWRQGRMSNLEYLMRLNVLGSRSFLDFSQYPVFPVLQKCLKEIMTREDYRDLGKPVGMCGTRAKTSAFEQRFRMGKLIEEQESCFYGTHYSYPGTVFNFLIRTRPMVRGARAIQGDKFDVPDRIFCSIESFLNNIFSAGPDVREMIPEFFYLPYMYTNINGFDFGVDQGGSRVSNVTLSIDDVNVSPHQMVCHMRSVLENNEVTRNLPRWIDLIFGCSQSGKAAVVSQNVFFYLTYPESLKKVVCASQHDLQRVLTQVYHFGQVPLKVFQGVHPSPGKKEFAVEIFGERSQVRLWTQDISSKVERESLLMVGQWCRCLLKRDKRRVLLINKDSILRVKVEEMQRRKKVNFKMGNSHVLLEVLRSRHFRRRIPKTAVFLCCGNMLIVTGTSTLILLNPRLQELLFEIRLDDQPITSIHYLDSRKILMRLSDNTLVFVRYTCSPPSLIEESRSVVYAGSSDCLSISVIEGEMLQVFGGWKVDVWSFRRRVAKILSVPLVCLKRFQDEFTSFKFFSSSGFQVSFVAVTSVDQEVRVLTVSSIGTVVGVFNEKLEKNDTSIFTRRLSSVGEQDRLVILMKSGRLIVLDLPLLLKARVYTIPKVNGGLVGVVDFQSSYLLWIETNEHKISQLLI